MKVYEYSKCSTCRKALKYLESRGVDYEKVDITQNPPTKSEIQKMIKAYDGEIKRLFNTSGQVYRAKKISSKLPNMSKKEVVELLAQNGKLIKRPFLLKADKGLVGFKEEEWNRVFS